MRNFKLSSQENRRLLAGVAALLLLLVPVLAQAEEATPIPAAPIALVHAQPFQVVEPFPYLWNASQPQVSSGWILVLEVQNDLVRPRQVAEPILYVGMDTAQKVNTGYRDGRLVVLTPSLVDLEQSPIWFGDPDLPEQVTFAVAQAQRQIADNSGVRPFSTEEILLARSAGGDTLVARDEWDLRKAAEAIAAEYAPLEAQANARP